MADDNAKDPLPLESVTRSGWADIVRPLLIGGIGLLFLILSVKGLGTSDRFLTLVFLAMIFSLGAAYELNERGLPEKYMVPTTLTIFVAAGLAYYLLNIWRPLASPSHAALLAAGDMTPMTACDGIPHTRSDLLMIVGKDAVIGAGNGPFSPVRAGTCPALTIERDGRGLIVSGFGFDSDDNVVYRIERNEISPIVQGDLIESHPDPSTLYVTDKARNEILYVRFLNDQAVRIRGTFRCGDTGPVAIGNDGVRVGRFSFTGSHCVAARTGKALEYSDRKPE